MKKKIIIGASLLIVLVAAIYWLFDYYTGNHIVVKEVFDSSKTAATGTALDAPPSELDKKWYVVEPSTVYFEVETSEESVFSQIPKMEGFWEFNLTNPEKMSAQVQLDLTSEDSGNSGRDNYIQSVLLPGEASFTLQTFDQWNNPGTAGQPIAYKMTGLIKIAGKEKIVQFTGEVLYEEAYLKLKGETTVTFADFGLTNPHLVTLTTQEDINIILQLVLSDKEPLKVPEAS